MVLVACLEGVYMIEQPANSVMVLHPRLYWAFRVLRQMAKIKVSRSVVKVVFPGFCFFQMGEKQSNCFLFGGSTILKLRPFAWCSTWRTLVPQPWSPQCYWQIHPPCAISNAVLDVRKWGPVLASPKCAVPCVAGTWTGRVAQGL